MARISKMIKIYSYIIFLIIVLAYILVQIYIKSHLPKLGWTVSDWLINYEDGGFKRRGLVGSLFFFIQDNLKITLNNQIFLVQAFCFILIFYFTIRLILSKRLNWDVLILLCSPLCLFFIPIDIFNSGRKEIILITLVLFFADGNPSRLKKYILFAGYILGLFMHELFYFYLPFVVALYVLKTNELDFKYICSLFLMSTTVMLLLFFFGTDINKGQSLEILRYRGIELNRWNIFTYDPVKEREEMLIAYKSYILFATELFFMIFLYLIFIKKYMTQKLNIAMLFTVISLVWVSPLYYLGADWFRWDHIYSILFIVLIISAMPENYKKTPNVEGRVNTSLIMANAVFLIVFFLHIQYDSSGNTNEFLLNFFDKIGWSSKK